MKKAISISMGPLNRDQAAWLAASRYQEKGNVSGIVPACSDAKRRMSADKPHQLALLRQGMEERL